MTHHSDRQGITSTPAWLYQVKDENREGKSIMRDLKLDTVPYLMVGDQVKDLPSGKTGTVTYVEERAGSHEQFVGVKAGCTMIHTVGSKLERVTS